MANKKYASEIRNMPAKVINFQKIHTAPNRMLIDLIDLKKMHNAKY